MFIGEYHHNLDGKGRLILPAKFRNHLGDRCIVTRGLDHCLFIFPLPEWQALENKLRNLPLTKPEARAFSRFFFSGATECELDAQGRILLPHSLRDYASINREVVIIGVATRIEIWAKDKWLEYSAQAEKAYEKLAEKMGDDGIFASGA
ncbi:MAG: Protein MraZ [Thermoanaerobacterales bacterium 50_218]|nr:MAG: Protein MraZ [Thermoanaerobacterales bacterium 50_218]HAA90423.1 cell division/cell wall cluster transcriptional repressor MraZ [Peptococcaceae bacterium]